MREYKPRERTIRQYLLGKLSDEERTQVEDRCFSDDEWFEQMVAVEDDLVDEYARGQLAHDLSQAFALRLEANDRLRRRVQFARALAQTVASERPVQRPQPGLLGLWEMLRGWLTVQPSPLRVGLMAACLLVLVAGPLLVLNSWRRQEVAGLRSDRLRLEESERQSREQMAGLQKRVDSLSGELERERQAREELQKGLQKSGSVPRLVAVSFVLTAGLIRGADEPIRVVVPRAAEEVRFQLDLETVGDYRSYRAELRTARGILLWSEDMLKARTTDWGKAIVLTLPSQLLQAGEHEVALHGLVDRGKFEQVGYYYFSVQRR